MTERQRDEMVMTMTTTGRTSTKKEAMVWAKTKTPT